MLVDCAELDKVSMFARGHPGERESTNFVRMVRAAKADSGRAGTQLQRNIIAGFKEHNVGVPSRWHREDKEKGNDGDRNTLHVVLLGDVTQERSEHSRIDQSRITTHVQSTMVLPARGICNADCAGTMLLE